MLPVKFVPKHEVVTFDDQTYYIDSEKFEAIRGEMESSKFITIGDTILAVSSIKQVRPAKQEISILEQMLSGKPETLKIAVRDKVAEREKEKMKTNEAVIANIIETFEQSRK